MLDGKMVVKVWCLPRTEEDKLHALFTNIVDAVVDLKIGIESEKDMVVLFPPDMMTYGLGTEVMVEITNAPGDDIPREPARRIGEIVKGAFPDAYVQCSVLRQGYVWYANY